MISSPVSYIGIDVAKAELEVAVGPSIAGSFPNTVAGITALQKRVPAPDQVGMVVIESTGCYSQLAARQLTMAG